MNRLELFIIQSNELHNSKYDYSLVEYKNTHTKVKIICPDHGIFEQSPVAHKRGQGCPLCANSKRISTWMKKYGVTHPRKNSNIVEKTKQTCLEKYGTTNPLLNEDVNQKSKDTFISKYGVENAFQSVDIQQKGKQTRLEKYGHENPAHGQLAQTKIKQTNIKKYGTYSAVSSSTIIRKIKQTKIESHKNDPTFATKVNQKRIDTNLVRFGVEYPIKDPEKLAHWKSIMIDQFGTIHMNNVPNYIDKKKATCMCKYGITTPSHRHMIESLPYLQDVNWMYDQYINQRKTASTIAGQLNITTATVCKYLRNYNIEVRQTCSHSSKCIQWLDLIMSTDNIHIQHALNDGEYPIIGTRYKADGYCKETNTIYEFHGDYWHGNPDVYESDIINESTQCTMGELYQKTLLKEEKIKELGYNLSVIWESEFDSLLLENNIV